ncbi:hypothetical protein Agabi119p4_11191 [Agaricus bisporus var. burnettii]|uniref:CUE domain-containing protein n=1 Tax=Agaricus bisporus var. burnettii TaxID=192524 RepID=A0A8H7C204_AGABI|nr:hypothetical protein AGABI2DRAFT_195337 [Agaricus bisporus var. bisporus H97]EKV43078.1 hypothetical protein AGABI2DRAFT_195337 [Agaricus bisporus var. bisporus H97]KAF7760515.1 hypothetical protein Agabi119p4_11191 [Agaricus bisporus var. burnettii]
MGEIVNVLVAFAVIVFLFRWATSGNNPHDNSRQRSPAELLGFRPKNVTQEMITTISNMFPDIPADNIRYDLLRSGSIEVTTNKILEKGYLDAPPAAYYTLYPRTNRAPQPHAHPHDRRSASHAERKAAEKKETLISRFKLEQRIGSEKGEIVNEEDVGGKAVWEDTAEKREASLKERKAKMILAARERFLAQQEKSRLASGSGSSSGIQS